MPAYDWTCSACGSENSSASDICLKCTCPANASFQQISEYRKFYVSQGGEVLPSAAKLSEADDYEILGTFAKALWRFIELVLAGPRIK